MAITSSSTVAEIEAEYRATLGFRSPIDVDLANRHLIAINAMVAMRPSSGAKGPNAFGFNVQALENQAARVEDWLARHDSDYLPGNRTLLVDFRGNSRA